MTTPDFNTIVTNMMEGDTETALGASDKINALLVYEAIKANLYPQTDTCGGIVVIDSAHEEIHEGNYWFVDDVSASLASGDIKYYYFVTPSDTTYFHSYPQFLGTGEFEIQSYEGATVATNGTEIALLNRNRVIGGTTNFKFYKDPTTPNTTGAILVRNVRVGAGQKAIGESRSENELILKPNTGYLIKITSRSAGNFVSTHMNGYTCSIG
jgi:hypothetical protein